MSEYREIPITFSLVIERGVDITHYENRSFVARAGEEEILSADTMEELMLCLEAKKIRIKES